MAKKDLTQENYMSSKEIADLLRLKDARNARAMMKKAGIRPVKVGRKHFIFKRKDVSFFIEERTRARV